MPFKSEAQRKKFAEMVEQGKMDQSTFDEWNKDSPEILPDRVTPEPKKGPQFVKIIRPIKPR
jgi:hypothetical protein